MGQLGLWGRSIPLSQHALAHFAHVGAHEPLCGPNSGRATSAPAARQRGGVTSSGKRPSGAQGRRSKARPAAGLPNRLPRAAPPNAKAEHDALGFCAGRLLGFQAPSPNSGRHPFQAIARRELQALGAADSPR